MPLSGKAAAGTRISFDQAGADDYMLVAALARAQPQGLLPLVRANATNTGQSTEAFSCQVFV